MNEATRLAPTQPKATTSGEPSTAPSHPAAGGTTSMGRAKV